MSTTTIELAALGLVNCLGMDRWEIAERLFAGDVTGMVPDDGWLADSGQALVGKVRGPLPDVPTSLASFDCRNNRLLLAALAQIRDEIDAAISEFGAERIGVVLGTSTSGIAEGEAAIAALHASAAMPARFHYRQQEIGAPSYFVSTYLALRGPALTVSTACTSSAKALVSARLLIASGVCDAVIAGGADSLCKLTVSGFASLESVSPQRANPMSVNRRGINIGEGAALFLMRRAACGVSLLGCGESSDAWHISAPHPEGLGAERAMRAALADARIDASELAYVNLHGTATPKNDEMESLAMYRVFPDKVPASSTKPLTGHLLGAAGATEAAFCWLSMHDELGRLPPHVWDGQADPALPSLNLVRPGDRMASDGRRLCMSNGYAFGGSNVCLVLGVCA